MKKTVSMLKNEGGAALMMAIFTVTMLMIIATEVMYETNVEFVVSSQAVNQVKAHFAAKAGVEISLLRIQIFRKASAMLGDKVPSSMLDPIWQMPFMWPPIVPSETSAVEKDEIKKAVKASTMQGEYFATIESEGSKIDLNDLGSPLPVLRDATRQQLLQIFQSKIEGDDEFATKFRGFSFEKLIDNITDWVDEDKEAKGGGDESANYPDKGPDDIIPPNQPFKTLAELHMVAEMTDELFDLISPRLTVFGVKGVNVNYASKDVLMALSEQITVERADKIIEMRAKPERGPFKDKADFLQFLNSLGVNGNPFEENGKAKVSLIFDAEHNFRIRSTGKSGRVNREITAIVYDFDRVRERMKEVAAIGATPTPAPAGAAQPPPGVSTIPTPTPTPSGTPAKKQIVVPNERPPIVYWNET